MLSTYNDSWDTSTINAIYLNMLWFLRSKTVCGADNFWKITYCFFVLIIDHHLILSHIYQISMTKEYIAHVVQMAKVGYFSVQHKTVEDILKEAVDFWKFFLYFQCQVILSRLHTTFSLFFFFLIEFRAGCILEHWKPIKTAKSGIH